MIYTLVVLAGWLGLTTVFVHLARTSLKTGVAPWQSLSIATGQPAITRTANPGAFWALAAPTFFGAVFGVIGTFVLILAVLGVFGPLD